MLKEDIKRRLEEMQQTHLAAKLDLLSEEAQKAFFDCLSPSLLKNQQECLKTSGRLANIEPICEVKSASPQWVPLGIERLTQRKVACLILAGGQGSRLESAIPKALIPITPDGKKTLLEIHLDKIETVAAIHQIQIPCAIITSPHNHHAIEQFLKKTNYGKFITLVTQDEAPFLDDNGNWFLKDNGEIAKGPDGNGYAIHLLAKNGILNKWRSSGIEEISLIPIDNPLADPVDPLFLGYHAAHQAHVTVKVITRNNPSEKVGIMVRKNGKVQVQEYSELAHDTPAGTCLAHIGIFALDLTFAERISQEVFPWHIARKQDPITRKIVWKFERFIFDMLTFSDHTHLLLYPREDVYAPLKNKTGEKSILTVQEALKRLT